MLSKKEQGAKNRAAITSALTIGDKALQDIITTTGIPYPTVARHITALVESGAVVKTKVGREIHVRLSAKGARSKKS